MLFQEAYIQQPTYFRSFTRTAAMAAALQLVLVVGAPERAFFLNCIAVLLWPLLRHVPSKMALLTSTTSSLFCIQGPVIEKVSGWIFTGQDVQACLLERCLSDGSVLSQNDAERS